MLKNDPIRLVRLPQQERLVRCHLSHVMDLDALWDSQKSSDPITSSYYPFKDLQFQIEQRIFLSTLKLVDCAFLWL